MMTRECFILLLRVRRYLSLKSGTHYKCDDKQSIGRNHQRAEAQQFSAFLHARRAASAQCQQMLIGFDVQRGGFILHGIKFPNWE